MPLLSQTRAEAFLELLDGLLTEEVFRRVVYSAPCDLIASRIFQMSGKLPVALAHDIKQTLSHRAAEDLGRLADEILLVVEAQEEDARKHPRSAHVELSAQALERIFDALNDWRAPQPETDIVYLGLKVSLCIYLLDLAAVRSARLTSSVSDAVVRLMRDYVEQRLQLQAGRRGQLAERARELGFKPLVVDKKAEALRAQALDWFESQGREAIEGGAVAWPQEVWARLRSEKD